MTLDSRLTEIDLANPTYLLVSGNDEQPNVVPLKTGGSVFVGAGSSCKVQLTDESVQQLHCMFSMGDDNVLKVQDWNTGATYLNGGLVSEEIAVQSGDMISIGCYSLTAVLDAEFHNGVAVEILGGSVFLNEENEAIELESPIQAITGLSEQTQTDETDLTSDVSGFSVGADPNLNGVVETKKNTEDGFQYDIDADLIGDTAVEGDNFDSLPEDLGFAFGVGSGDGTNDEASLLLMELEQLRFELADRDSQILAFKNERDSSAQATTVDDDDTLKLVSRLEDLLVELKTSDGRIQNLEDLLRLSDEATAAERDERAQMEAWVLEIENRVGQREVESEAEIGSLKKQLKIAKDDAVVLQSAMHSLAIAGDGNEKQSEAVAALNRQVEVLRASLQEANEKNRELLERPVHSEGELDLPSKLRDAQDELAKLRLELSQGRAETARRRAELEGMRTELERQLSQTTHDGDDGDSRIRAMREHLREIHAQEQASKVEQQASSLSGRISNLLSRLH